MVLKGIGVDIVEISRIEKAVKRWGDHFLDYVFTDKEIAYARAHKFPLQHFAVRFAAKEAIYKAIGNNARLGWKDMEILNDRYGRPQCIFKKKNLKYKVLISLSHSEHYAVANALISS